MRDQHAAFEEGSNLPSSAHPSQPPSIPANITNFPVVTPLTPRSASQPNGGGGRNAPLHMPYGPNRSIDLQALRQALSDQPGTPPATLLGDDDGYEVAGGEQDAPTNVYYLAQYMYQISISAVSMSEHELGLLLPRSGRVWFNARLFSDVPQGRTLAQRDAWWRVVDASPAVRFLLGWSVALYGVAKFRNVAHDRLPNWTRMLYFSPAQPDCTRMRLQLWSDVIQDVTMLFAPASRIWRQIQMFTPIRAGDRRWQARLALANHRVEDVTRYLADRNNCPATLIRRSLDGNPAINSYDEYFDFTEAILEDLPRLHMQRVIAMQEAGEKRRESGRSQRSANEGFFARIPQAFASQAISEIEDPRANATFWRLHL